MTKFLRCNLCIYEPRWKTCHQDVTSRIPLECCSTATKQNQRSRKDSERVQAVDQKRIITQVEPSWFANVGDKNCKVAGAGFFPFMAQIQPMPGTMQRHHTCRWVGLCPFVSHEVCKGCFSLKSQEEKGLMHILGIIGIPKPWTCRWADTQKLSVEWQRVWSVPCATGCVVGFNCHGEPHRADSNSVCTTLDQRCPSCWFQGLLSRGYDVCLCFQTQTTLMMFYDCLSLHVAWSILE